MSLPKYTHLKAFPNRKVGMSGNNGTRQLTNSNMAPQDGARNKLKGKAPKVDESTLSARGRVSPLANAVLAVGASAALVAGAAALSGCSKHHSKKDLDAGDASSQVDSETGEGRTKDSESGNGQEDTGTGRGPRDSEVRIDAGQLDTDTSSQEEGADGGEQDGGDFPNINHDGGPAATDGDTDTNNEAGTGTAERGTGTEEEAGTGSDVNTDTNSEDGTGSEPADAGPDGSVEGDTSSEQGGTGSGSVTDTSPEQETGSSSDTESGTGPGGTDSSTGSGQETSDTESGSESASETGTSSETSSGTDSSTETGTASGADTSSETETGSATESGSGADTSSSTETGSATGSDTASDTKSDTATETSCSSDTYDFGDGLTQEDAGVTNVTGLGTFAGIKEEGGEVLVYFGDKYAEVPDMSQGEEVDIGTTGYKIRQNGYIGAVPYFVLVDPAGETTPLPMNEGDFVSMNLGWAPVVFGVHLGGLDNTFRVGFYEPSSFRIYTLGEGCTTGQYSDGTLTSLSI
jgi:hypothetical protein